MDKKGDIKVIDFGISDYREIIGLQNTIVEFRKKGLISDVLLLGEHPHVISLGFRAHHDANGIRDYGLLDGMNIPIYPVMRGGLATYHGPGQIVGYPILNLRENGMRVSQFVEMIGDILVDVLLGMGIKAYFDPNRIGVWFNGKKIVSIGLGLSSGITFHGFALNVNTDLRYFDLIVPCGMEDIRMTSIKDILKKDVSMSNVKESIIKSLTAKFEKPCSEIREYASPNREACLA